jgi:hypothetical protein
MADLYAVDIKERRTVRLYVRAESEEQAREAAEELATEELKSPSGAADRRIGGRADLSHLLDEQYQLNLCYAACGKGRHLCSYHNGFRDALEAAEEFLERQALAKVKS